LFAQKITNNCKNLLSQFFKTFFNFLNGSTKEDELHIIIIVSECGKFAAFYLSLLAVKAESEINCVH
jgi:hypothetical protein